MGRHIKDMANPAVDRVLIYAGDGGCYWREGGCGYTSAQYAGVYTRAEAYANAGHCGPEKRVELHDVPDDHIPTLRARVAELEAALEKTKQEWLALVAENSLLIEYIPDTIDRDLTFKIMAREMKGYANLAKRDSKLKAEGAATAWDKIAEIGEGVTEKAIRVTAQYAREQAARERGAK